MMIEPSKCTLNDPPASQNGKAFLLFWPEHDLQTKATVFCYPIEQLAAIGDSVLSCVGTECVVLVEPPEGGAAMICPSAPVAR